MEQWKPKNLAISGDVLFDEDGIFFVSKHANRPDAELEDNVFDCSNNNSPTDAEYAPRCRNTQASDKSSTTTDRSVVHHREFASDGPLEPSQVVRVSTWTLRSPTERGNPFTLFTSDAADEILTFSLATKGKNKECWLSAVNNEMSSLAKDNTLVLVPRKDAANILTYKWAFRPKEVIVQNGQLQFMFKAQLVTRGIQQIQWIGYEKTFATVIQSSTLRLVLAIPTSENL